MFGEVCAAAACGANQLSCGNDLAIISRAASPYDCQASVPATPMQSVIRKRARTRRARLRRDGRILGKLSFFESAQREVSSISGSVRHVETSDREWLSLELTGTPRSADNCPLSSSLSFSAWE